VSDAAIADRLAISDVLIRYATALDTRNWDLFRTCFTDDCVCDYDPVGPREGYADFEALARGYVEPLAATQHLVTNHVIEISGDTATARSYAHAMHVSATGAQFVIAGAYEDELVRTSDGWRIRHRKFPISWWSGDPAAIGLDPALLGGT
jgi:3-phenylpropionate/cinnamic acid dioxygenase small subunit